MSATLNIEKEDIKLPNAQDKDKLAFVLKNVLTVEECNKWIELSEARGYGPALLNMGVMQVLRPDVRNSDRCIIDDFQMAQDIFERIKTFLPPEQGTLKLVGINERLRFLRYDIGHKFEAHYDGSYHREDGSKERSVITVQLYLNEGFQGGETTFVHNSDDSKNVPYIPRTGSALIFHHNILHEGSAVKDGRKYTVRTEAMYKP